MNNPIDTHAPKPPPLLRLPPELSTTIFTHLPLPTLKNLSLTTSTLQPLVDPLLYAHITVPPSRGYGTRLFYLGLAYRPHLVQHVRTLFLGDVDFIGLRMLLRWEWPSLVELRLSSVVRGAIPGVGGEESAGRLNEGVRAQGRLREIWLWISFADGDGDLGRYYPLRATDAPLLSHPNLHTLALWGFDLTAFSTCTFALPNLNSLLIEDSTHDSIAPLRNLTATTTTLRDLQIRTPTCRPPFPVSELEGLLWPHRATLRSLTLCFNGAECVGLPDDDDAAALAYLSTFPKLTYLRAPLNLLFRRAEFHTPPPDHRIVSSALPPNLKLLLPEHLVCPGAVPEPAGHVFRLDEAAENILTHILAHLPTLAPALSRIWLLYAPYLDEPSPLHALASQQDVHMTQLWPSEARPLPPDAWLDDTRREELIFAEGEASTVKERSLLGCPNKSTCLRRVCKDGGPSEGFVRWILGDGGERASVT